MTKHDSGGPLRETQAVGVGARGWFGWGEEELKIPLPSPVLIPAHEALQEV